MNTAPGRHRRLSCGCPFAPVRVVRVPWLIPRWASAQVWGRYIFVRRGVAVTEQLLAHELAHVLQWRLLGIVPFLFNYLRYFVRCGYWNHPLERQARAAEEQDFYRAWARRLLAPQSRAGKRSVSAF